MRGLFIFDTMDESVMAPNLTSTDHNFINDGMTAMTDGISAVLRKARSKKLQWKVTGSKICPRCGENKSISEYHRRSSGEQIASYCKSCESARAAEKKPRKTPIRFESETHRECRMCLSVKPKDGGFYKTKNGSGVRGYTIYCRKCQLSKTKASRDKSEEPYWRKYQQKINGDPQLRLKARAIGLVRASLKGRLKYKKTGSVSSGFWESVGYTQEELFRHIEKQLKNGMHWSNMNKWHIDHIIPDSSFEYHSMDCDGFRQSWALTNLRPLWAKENESKGAGIYFLI